MVDELAGGGRPGQAAFLDRLYRQAARRWLILLFALAFLFWLGFFAGRVRNPDAVKQEWAVLVSRVLAAAGGFVLIRLLLFAYEERVPVLLFDLRSSEGGSVMLKAVGDCIRRLQERGYEVVPLGDVVQFVRERRYVPRKCLGVVIETESAEDLTAIGGVLPNLDVAVLLPPEALESDANRRKGAGISRRISLGISLVDKPDLPDAGRLKAALGHFRALAVGVTGLEPRYARVSPSAGIELRGLLKETTYTCFLDGRGFNRFGDEAHMLRLLDATAMAERGRLGASLPVYVGLYKGRYYLWPVAAALRLMGARPEG